MVELIDQNSWFLIGLIMLMLLYRQGMDMGLFGGSRTHGEMRPRAGKPALTGEKGDWRGKAKIIKEDFTNNRVLLFLRDFPKDPIPIAYEAVDAWQPTREQKLRIMAGDIRDMPIKLPATSSGKLALPQQATANVEYYKSKVEQIKAEKAGLFEQTLRLSDGSEREFQRDVDRLKKVQEIRSPMEEMLGRKFMKGMDRDVA